MSRLRTNPTLLTGLYNNTPFVYAHLVKFERPTAESSTNVIRNNSTHYSRFAYITDAAYDIDFDDGTTYEISNNVNSPFNGTQTYVANKLLKVGNTQETTKIKVNSIGIDIDATALDVSIGDTFTLTRNDIAASGGVQSKIAGTISLSSNPTTNIRDNNFSSLGFKVDDKIKFSNRDYILRVTGFSNHGNTISFIYIDGNPASGNTLPNNGSSTTFYSPELKVSNEESSFVLTNSLDTSYVNRKVTVYKAFFYADNPHLMMGTPIKMFEGIITAGAYKETATKAVMSWTIKSHWGDWEQKKGRVTSADFHQALDQNGQPNRRSVLKPEYAYDYGFMHAEQSLSVIATYTDTVQDMKEHKKKNWIGISKYKYEMIDVEVTRQTDLRFDLQARRIPIVYGVQRITPIPIFADVSAETGKSNEVFLVHALSEGPIHSIMNIYVDDIPLVCVDEADHSARFNNTQVDVECVGRTDQGLVLGGATPITSGGAISWQSEDGTKTITQEQMDKIIDQAENAAANVGQLINQSMTVNSHIAATKQSSFTADSIGITHERKLTFDTPIGWELEFHAGFNDQKASSLISTQANTTGKKFRVQQDYWTSGNSGVEYWGPGHTLLDTAYTALKFELTADQTTAPNLQYVVKGKMVECFNYDGSFMHSTLPTHSSESITNFKEGDVVYLKTGRAFTASSDTGTYAGSKSANDTLFTATIIEIFYYVDARRTLNWRVRWNLTGDQQDLLNEAKHFYMQKASDTWNMITWDGTVNIDTVFSVAETITSEINAPSSSGTANVTATLSDPPSNIVDYTSDGNAEFAYYEDVALSADDFDNMTGKRKFSQPAQGTYNSGNNSVTLANTSSTTAPTATKIAIVNKVKLQGSGISTTDDFYNDRYISVRRYDEDGDSYTISRKIIDYVGSTQIATVERAWSVEDIPAVGERITIFFGAEESVAYGQDLRPSINFVPMLMDYLTSRTYGASVTLDQLDLDSFRLAAQMCDTQSDVIVEFNSAVTLVAGEEYRYYVSGHEKWRGTVLHNYNSSTKAFGGTGAENHWVFTNVTGKLTNKWNDWKSRNVGDLIWDSGTSSLYIKTTSAAVQSSISNGASVATTVTLTRLTGSGPASPQIKSTNLVGNPVAYTMYDSDSVKFWKYLGWEDQAQRYVTRHQGNINVDTNQTVFAIIDGFLDHFNGQLAFVDGKYRLTVESTRLDSESDTNFTDTALLAGSGTPTVGDLDLRARYITEADIIGDIGIKDQGLSKSYNSMNAQIDDPQINFSSRSVSFFDSNYLKKDRGIVKSTQFQAKGITNYFNARMLVKQVLDRSRYNRKISFKMAPIGLAILPGELIRIEYDRFGWSSTNAKIFRVETVGLEQDCLVTITASEYNDSIYTISPPKNSAFYANNEAVAVARAPSAPTGVSVTTGGDAGANVISWVPSTGVSPIAGHYEIWRATSLSGDPSTSVTSHAELIHTLKAEQSHAASPSTSRPRFSDIGFTNSSNLTYRYWVRAYNNLEVQTTSGTERKNYYSPFNANSNYTGVTEAAAVARLAGDGTPGVSAISIGQNTFSTLVNCSSNGTPILSSGVIPDSANEIKVFEGTTPLQYDGVGTSNGTWTVTITATNVTAGSISDSGSYASISGATGMSADLGSLVFSISGKNASGTAFTSTATQAFSKVIPAASGRTVELSASKYVINFTEAGAESDSITLTGTATGFDHITPHFAFYKKEANGSFTLKQNFSGTNTFTIADSDEPTTGASVLFKVEVKASTGGSVLATDFVSIYGVQDGSDAITAFLTNPSATLPAANNGTVSSFSNATGRVKVFVGGTDVSTNNDVTYTTSNASNTGTIAINNTSSSSKGIYSVGALSADSGSVDITATIAANSSLLGGTGAAQKTVTIPFTLSKAIKGDEGPTSTVPGPDGKQSAQGYLFYESTGTTAPAAPSGNTFTISTGLVAGTGISASSTTGVWTNSPRTQDATSTGTFWTVRYSGVQSNSTDTTIAVTYSTVVKQTSFSGLVTFSGGTFSEDGQNITNIDGGNITTGTIKSSNFPGSGSSQGADGTGFSTSGMALNLANGTITSSKLRLDSSGNLALNGFATTTQLDAKTTTFRQSTVPTGAAGDFWIATGNTHAWQKNQLYQAVGVATAIVTSGSGWYLVTDGNLQAQVTSAAGTASNAAGAASSASSAASSAAATASTANNRAQNFDTSGDLNSGFDVGTGAHIKGGQSAYNNGTGFFLGYSGSAYKFSIGNSAGNRLFFDGSTLGVTGNIDARSLTLSSLDSTGKTNLGNSLTNNDTSSGSSNSNTSGGGDVTLYNHNGVLKVKSNSLSGSNHLVQESTVLKRFSNDKDFFITTTGGAYWHEIADLWWKLDTYGGPITEYDVVMVRAGANVYLSNSNGYTRYHQVTGTYSAKCTLQLGTTQPESGSTANSLYGNKTNRNVISNLVGSHYFSDPLGIEAMRYELALNSSGTGSVAGGGSYYKANSVTNSSQTFPTSNATASMDKRVIISNEANQFLQMADTIKRTDAQSEDGKSHHRSGGRYYGLRTGSNYAYFRLWVSFATSSSSAARRLNFIDPHIEVTIIRNSNDDAAA